MYFHKQVVMMLSSEDFNSPLNRFVVDRVKELVSMSGWLKNPMYSVYTAASLFRLGAVKSCIMGGLLQELFSRVL